MLNESEGSDCWSVLIVNDENGEGAQGPDNSVVVSHRSSDLISTSCSLELLRVFHYYGECYVVCVNFLFLFKSGSPEHDLKKPPLTTVTYIYGMTY